MMMFSLAGIPPLAGFFAKFYVFAAAIRRPSLVVLAVIGVVTSVVGAYYYIRIVKIMYFDEPKPRLRARCRPASQVVLVACRASSSCCSGCCRRRSSARPAPRPSLF